MFRNQKTFKGNLVSIGELMKSKNDNFYLRLSVVESYSEKQEDGSYKELDGIFHNLTLFGKQAELFAKSNIPKGTPLFIQGETSARTRPSYTDKQGVVHPESVESQINVNGIGVLIDYGRVVDVSFGKDRTATAPQAATAQSVPQASPVQQAPTAPVYDQTPPTQTIQETPSSSLFGDDDDFDVF